MLICWQQAWHGDRQLLGSKFRMEWCAPAPRRADDEFDTEVPQRCWRPLVAVLSIIIPPRAVVLGYARLVGRFFVGARADAAVREQMERDRQQIERLKRDINRLLDSISLQEAARYDEYRELRSRTARARQEYEEGVNKRIGGVANDGRYAASQKIQLGNSFSGLINSQDDVLSKIYENNQQQEDGAPPPPKKKLFGFK